MTRRVTVTRINIKIMGQSNVGPMVPLGFLRSLRWLLIHKLAGCSVLQTYCILMHRMLYPRYIRFLLWQLCCILYVCCVLSLWKLLVSSICLEHKLPALLMHGWLLPDLGFCLMIFLLPEWCVCPLANDGLFLKELDILLLLCSEF